MQCSSDGSIRGKTASELNEKAGVADQECVGKMVFSLTAKQVLHSANKNVLQCNVKGPKNSNVITGVVFGKLKEKKELQLQ